MNRSRRGQSPRDRRRPIIYLGHYVSESNPQGRLAAASAVDKIDYVTRTITSAGTAVRMVSSAKTFDNRFHASSVEALAGDRELVSFATLPWIGKGGKLLSLVFGDLALFFYLLSHTDRWDTVVAYHSLDYRWVLRAARWVRRFRLVLEVEEVYQDVSQLSKGRARSELATIACADHLILSTELLRERLAVDESKSIVCHGNYHPDLVASRNVPVWDNDLVHVVYAGIIDSAKNGAFVAVEAARYLNSSFHIHILGFGSADEIGKLTELVKLVSQTAECRVSYDGLLRGQDFSGFLHGCSIGLSTQDGLGKYNASSFPSKVLTYLRHGLNVVSVPVPALECSVLSSAVVFAKGGDPQNVAEAIATASSSPILDTYGLLHSLDIKFREEMEQLLSRSR